MRIQRAAVAMVVAAIVPLGVTSAGDSKARDEPETGAVSASCPDSYLHLDNWNAVHNAMPPGPDSLYVQGDVVVATLGYSVGLEPAIPPGISPKILILDLSVTKPPGPAGQQIDTLTARWDHDGEYDGGYDRVDIRCGSDIVLELDVEKVE